MKITKDNILDKILAGEALWDIEEPLMMRVNAMLHVRDVLRDALDHMVAASSSAGVLRGALCVIDGLVSTVDGGALCAVDGLGKK